MAWLAAALLQVQWKADYEAGLAAAREEGKLLVVHFWLDGRPLCKTMNDETFAHAEVIRLANEKFVNVKVEIDKRPELFRATVGGRGGLATCVLDGTGDVVSVLPGFAEAAAYVRFLDRAARGHAALRAVREAAEKDPADPGALQALGEAYERLESPRRAEESYLKAAGTGKGTPGVAFSYERLARLRIFRGKNLEAREYVAQYRKLDPEGKLGREDRIRLTEALILAVERKLAESVRVVEEAIRQYPESPEMDQMLLTAGWVRHEAGDDKGGLRLLETLVAKFPQSSWVALARERIEHIKNPQPDHQH
jgi:tetratricopeptide (TPR) repeat protein